MAKEAAWNFQINILEASSAQRGLMGNQSDTKVPGIQRRSLTLGPLWKECIHQIEMIKMLSRTFGAYRELRGQKLAPGARQSRDWVNSLHISS